MVNWTKGVAIFFICAFCLQVLYYVPNIGSENEIEKNNKNEPPEIFRKQLKIKNSILLKKLKQNKFDDFDEEPVIQNNEKNKEKQFKTIKFTKKATNVISNSLPIQRAVGTDALNFIDPFVLIDDIGPIKMTFENKEFKQHPHIGYEILKIILRGEMEIQDSKGNKQTLKEGDVEWISSGSGIIHQEIISKNQEFHAIEVWIKLPKSKNKNRPIHQFIGKNKIPNIKFDGGDIRILAGKAKNDKERISSLISSQVPIRILDVSLKKNFKIIHKISM